jgi:hypothetical protein
VKIISQPFCFNITDSLIDYFDNAILLLCPTTNPEIGIIGTINFKGTEELIPFDKRGCLVRQPLYYKF